MTQPQKRKPYVTTYTQAEWKHVTIKGDARIEWLQPGDKRRPGYDPEPGALVRVYLNSGSLHRYSAHLTDEGNSYSMEDIEEAEDGEGAPCWVIKDEEGGRDCDGEHANHWKGISYGDLPEGAWCSDAKRISASVYDQYARMAGY